MNLNHLPPKFNNPLIFALARQINDPIIILDAKFNVLLFNYSAEKLFCYTEKKSIKKSFNKICSELGIECFIDSYKDKIMRSVPLNISSTIYNFKVIWQAQTITIDNNNFYLLKANNNEREEKNKQNEIHQLKTLIENMPCNVYWMDKNCTMMGCNQNVLNMLNITREQFHGKSYEELSALCHWPEGLAYKLKNDDLSVMHTGKPIIANEDPPIPNGDGTFSNFLTSRVPLKNQNGEIVGVAGISTEVSALKEAKKKAEAANHAKTEFIANMSHDIRTPLTGVIGISDILEKLEANPELKQYAHDIHDCGQQLLAMLNSILDVVSADHVNEQDNVIETFNLTQCIEEVIHLEKPTMVVKHLDLRVDIDQTIPAFLVNDKTKIHRILLNLFSNAVKFTEKGSITLKVQLLNIQNHLAKVRFSVTDTGIGIPKEQQQKVFDRFFRASPSYKRQYTGHGVGLHIAQSYAKSLDTEIKLLSQEGIGTTFYIDITSAIGVADTLHDNIQQPCSKKSASIKNQTCLLVEDNPIALKILESIVADAGITYQSNIDGESALQTATTQSFDFIITDIGLPKMSGYDFVEKYRRWEKKQNKSPIPIFALTAHAANNELSTKCLQVGINAIYAKPFSSQTLYKILSDHFQIPPPNINQLSPIKSQNGPLESDLPDTEEALFLLNQFAILDSKKALSFVANDTNALKNILKAMANEELPNEAKQLKMAYLSKDWDTIENLAHKIKGGAIYLGTEQLKFACQYFERYKKAGHTPLLEKLYQQMVRVMDKTRQAICEYLRQKK